MHIARPNPWNIGKYDKILFPGSVLSTIKSQCLAIALKQILDNSTHDKIAILCRARGNNSDIIECVLNSTGIDYFYGMFTDEDENYVSFHQKCQDVFIKKFSKKLLQC